MRKKSSFIKFQINKLIFKEVNSTFFNDKACGL